MRTTTSEALLPQLVRHPVSAKAPHSCPKESGKEKAHKHKHFFPVIVRVGGGPDRRRPGGQGSPDGWPGVKSLCAVCGTQGI